MVPEEVVAHPSHGHNTGFAGERAGKQYPLPWFPFSDDPSRYRYRTTAGYRPYRSSPWDVDVVAVEVVHFLRLSSSALATARTADGLPRRAACSRRLTCPFCRVGFGANPCHASFWNDVPCVCNAVSKERRVPEKIFAQLCFGLHQMLICADAQR